MSPRIALVTGGTGGIGRETCRQLARAGLRVVAGDLPADAARLADFQETMVGLDVIFQPLDVADPTSCAAALAAIERSHGPVDVLVNAAGITRDATLRKMSREQWDDVLSVNLDSVFTLCKLVVDGMCERGFGRIVNISSVNGQTGQFGQTNYAAAKAGMHGFTMALAREVARKGVTVNSVSPGYIRTAMTEAMPEDVKQQVLAMVPAGRIGEPADIARAVVFLCDGQAGYLTGVNLPVNGGLFISF
ncbi:acetoacetyl-CoA reductase [Arenimonas daejeonensis]|uniref:acetoacetyl-CoA reductase n=1 Tax=Arenimonas daejeonensis TaxID=370777 RepID=UPI0011BD56F5|nr:acetoacetyl-CoA reductase [Arenimonas daejeonensis]